MSQKQKPDPLEVLALPRVIESEAAAIGGILGKHELLDDALSFLQAGDFWDDRHRALFEALTELQSKRVPFDLVALGQLIKENGFKDRVDVAYLAELFKDSWPPSAIHHCRLVKEYSTRRHLADVGRQLVYAVHEPGKDMGGMMADASVALLGITEKTSTKGIQEGKDLLDKCIEKAALKSKNPGHDVGLSTGFASVDKILHGYKSPDLILLAARPSMGKTAWAVNSGIRLAATKQETVLFCSLEMSADQIMQRAVASEAKVPAFKMESGYLSEEEWSRIYTAADFIQKAPFLVDDTGGLQMQELWAKCRRIKRERGLGLVIVDYLQLMRHDGRIDSREQQISYISRSLKAMAKDLKIPVLALSQLNRKVEERQIKIPGLSDLRESGALEQDADIIMFLYRDEVYNKRDDNPKKGIAELIIGKHRNGACGTVHLAFLQAFTAFEELAKA